MDLAFNCRLLISFLLAPMLAFCQEDLDQSSALGVWLTTNGMEQIEVYLQDGKICGKIIWIKKEAESGIIKIDENNPDPNLRTRPVVGIEMLYNFTYAGKGLFTGGKIYDPVSGKTYQARIKLLDNERAKIRGFVGIPLFGRTEFCTKITK